MNWRHIYIDASQLNALLDGMRDKLTPQEFDKLMRRSMNEVGRKAKKPIAAAIMTQYDAPANWVKSSIKGARVNGGGGDVFCVIPVIGSKGAIGGSFKAAGGARGWKVRKYKITAKIVKGSTSKLPGSMVSYGGQPPFRNLAAAKLNNIAFTRAGKSQFPIEKVSGIAVPQMPMNRARPETERAIVRIAEERVLHNFSYLFG